MPLPVLSLILTSACDEVWNGSSEWKLLSDGFSSAEVLGVLNYFQAVADSNHQGDAIEKHHRKQILTTLSETASRSEDSNADGVELNISRITQTINAVAQGATAGRGSDRDNQPGVARERLRRRDALRTRDSHHHPHGAARRPGEQTYGGRPMTPPPTHPPSPMRAPMNRAA